MSRESIKPKLTVDYEDHLKAVRAAREDMLDKYFYYMSAYYDLKEISVFKFAWMKVVRLYRYYVIKYKTRGEEGEN